MKTVLKIIVLSSLLISAPWTHAQSSTTTANSDSNANSTATGNANGTNTNIINFPSGPANSAHQETVEYKGSYTMKSAPALYAPPLVTTMTDTCMGSTSMGASFSGFGFNGGSTWTDKNCVRRLDAREFRAMGMNDVAIALLCQNPENQFAVEATGRACPNAKANAQTEIRDLKAVDTTPIAATPHDSASSTAASAPRPERESKR